MDKGSQIGGWGPQGARQGRSRTALALIFTALTLCGCSSLSSPEPTSDDWLRAEVASRSGEWDRAADLWNRIRLESYDRTVRPHLETAEALTRLDQEDEALALLRRAAELFPAEAEVPLAQGLLLERMGFRRAAELDLVAATELDPIDAEAHLALGRVRQALDQPRSARISLRRAAGLGADGAEVHRLLARIERALGLVTDAHASYGRAIERERDARGLPTADLLVEAASLHTDRSGDLRDCPLLAEALAWTELASEIDPQCARCSFVRAGLLERGGEVEAAIQAYRRAVEIDNLHLGAITNLALLHSKRGEQAAARAMVDRAVALEGDSRRRRALLTLVQ